MFSWDEAFVYRCMIDTYYTYVASNAAAHAVISKTDLKSPATVLATGKSCVEWYNNLGLIKVPATQAMIKTSLEEVKKRKLDKRSFEEKSDLE
mmetsp:Transcript_18271/g.8499  ORF Transcript_18271/g.8499 Transcript_18271/m.8499 type:complete len:93 (+) Transcript_18271:158-436(+)